MSKRKQEQVCRKHMSSCQNENIKEAKRQKSVKETSEERTARLRRMKVSYHENISNEGSLERSLRLQKKKMIFKVQLLSETPKKRLVRLARKSQNDRAQSPESRLLKIARARSLRQTQAEPTGVSLKVAESFVTDSRAVARFLCLAVAVPHPKKFYEPRSREENFFGLLGGRGACFHGKLLK